jgi:hypothetical protein
MTYRCQECYKFVSLIFECPHCDHKHFECSNCGEIDDSEVEEV